MQKSLGLIYACYMHMYMYTACKHNLFVVYRTKTPVFFKECHVNKLHSGVNFLPYDCKSSATGDWLLSSCCLTVLLGTIKLKKKLDLQKLTFS